MFTCLNVASVFDWKGALCFILTKISLKQKEIIISMNSS